MGTQGLSLMLSPNKDIGRRGFERKIKDRRCVTPAMFSCFSSSIPEPLICQMLSQADHQHVEFFTEITANFQTKDQSLVSINVTHIMTSFKWYIHFSFQNYTLRFAL